MDMNMNMNLTKGVDIFSILSRKSKLETETDTNVNTEIKPDIFSDIEEDFNKYPDFRKINIFIKHAIVNENQVQFEDLLQFNYVFGQYHEKKNSPLYTFTEKKIKMSHVPGHVIHHFTGNDRLFKKPKNQTNEAYIKIEPKIDDNIELSLDFNKVGLFIRKFIKSFIAKYPELKDCFQLNARGIKDIEWGVPPIIGFIKGESFDNLEYLYSYRHNENPNNLHTKFRNMTREDIEKSQKSRDHNLYGPIHKKISKDLLNIQQELIIYLSPIEKYCDILFGTQKYVIEHNENKLKITYKVKTIENFQLELQSLMRKIPDGYELVKTEYDKHEHLSWGVLYFEYNP